MSTKLIERLEEEAREVQRLADNHMAEYDMDAAENIADTAREAAARLRKLEAVREAAIPVAENVTPENWCELQRALAACGDECEHVWLHDIRQLTTKENRCTLCGEPKT